VSTAPADTAVIVRCDASAPIGAGHLTRCRALAHALRGLGAAALFALRDDARAARELVAGDGFPAMDVPVESPLGDRDVAAVLAAAEATGARCVLVDHYEAPSAYFAALADAGLLVAAVDDRADRDLTVVQWLLNQNLPAAELEYQLGPEATRLLGVEYALLRPEFAQTRARLERRFGASDANVLVTFGGGDTVGVASVVVAALAKLERRLEVRVVVGRGAAGLERLRAQAERSPLAVSVLHDVTDMASLMAWADLSVNAGGSTCWELMCLGVPMIVTGLSDDQRLNQRPLADAGVAVAAPRRKLDGVGALVASLLDDPGRRARMSARAAALVDGKGAARAAASLVAALEREQTGASR
jgi:UDP-2,4-diacetamido-2,4,6-trideoxy-beta-L-altropyranose hydrolase